MKRTAFSKKRNVRYPMEEPKIIYGNKVSCWDGKELMDPKPVAKPRAQLKRTPFTKKHKVVHKVENPNGDAKLSLVNKATKLRGEIFTNLHCSMCWENGDHNINTVPHHILNKGNYDRLRFVIMNLIPLCSYHHILFAHDCEQEFRNWLLDNLPRHYRYYLNERDNRKPVRQTVESLTKIVADLQYYADHPLEAEQVIYEKD